MQFFLGSQKFYETEESIMHRSRLNNEPSSAALFPFATRTQFNLDYAEARRLTRRTRNWFADRSRRRFFARTPTGRRLTFLKAAEGKKMSETSAARKASGVFSSRERILSDGKRIHAKAKAVNERFKPPPPRQL